MTWEQKLQALQALTDTSLRMRKPGDWYVCAVGRSVKEGAFLKGEYGNGISPESAVEDDFKKVAELLPPEHYIVVDRNGKRLARKWNGFMWQEVFE